MTESRENCQYCHIPTAAQRKNRTRDSEAATADMDEKSGKLKHAKDNCDQEEGNERSGSRPDGMKLNGNCLAESRTDTHATRDDNLLEIDGTLKQSITYCTLRKLRILDAISEAVLLDEIKPSTELQQLYGIHCLF